VFAVITCTKPLVVSSVRLSPPNVEGASACARAPALKVTETNAVASAKKIGCRRTRARYAGNEEPWQAFFYKNRWQRVGYLGHGFRRQRKWRPTSFQSSG